VQNLVTRQRTVVANFKGSNSAPSWSPDGSRLAVALTRDGLTQVYIINADGSGVRRLTNTNGIDTNRSFPRMAAAFTSPVIAAAARKSTKSASAAATLSA